MGGRLQVYLDEMAGRVREAQGELLDQTAQPWVFEAAQSMGRTTFEVRWWLVLPAVC